MAAAWVLALVVLTLPLPATAPDFADHLDASWSLGLVMAATKGIPAGRILWTYGPLGRLEVLIPWMRPEWVEALLTVVAVDAVFCGLMSLLLLRMRASVLIWIVATAALLAPNFVMPVAFSDGLLASVEYQLAFIGIMALLLAAIGAPRRATASLGVLCGAAFGTLALVKQTGAIVAVATLVVSALVAWRVPQLRRTTAVACVTTVLAAALLWFISGQTATDIGQYVRGSISLTADYRSAMSFGGDQGVPGALLVLACIVATALLTAWRRDWLRSFACVIALPLLVETFQEAFSRNDSAHAPVFACVASVVAVLILASGPARRWHDQRGALDLTVHALPLVLAVVLVVVTYLTLPQAASVATLGTRLAAWPPALQMAAGNRSSSPSPGGLRTELLAGYASSRTEAAAIGSSTVDVYPWEIDLAWTYGLQWDPRPVLASYSAYDAYLDGLDAQQLLTASRPTYLLYDAAETIDGRYAAFDEPLYFQAVLRTYTLDKVTGSPFLLLRARTNPLALPARQLGTTCALPGAPIAVPQAHGELVFANVSFPYSLGGTVLKTLFKAAYPTVSFQTGAGWTPQFRWVAAQGGSGLLVSGLVQTDTEFAALLQGQTAAPVQAISISSSQPADFANRVCAAFWSEPAP